MLNTTTFGVLIKYSKSVFRKKLVFSQKGIRDEPLDSETFSIVPPSLFNFIILNTASIESPQITNQK